MRDNAEAPPADLAGVKIVDFSPTVGTLATSALADMGAEVIHVGRPSFGQTLQPVGRNKRSIALDLKSDSGREVAHALAARADVVVEGFRPGVAARLGIDYQTLSQSNPSLVYCSLSGYGQDGPYSQWAGHDLNYQGVAGSVQFDEHDRPVMPSGPWSDRDAGYNLQIAILRGLLARQLHGGGQWFDVAMVDATASVPLTQQYAVDGVGRMPTGGMSGSSLPATTMIKGDYCWYSMYQCADGLWLSVGCLEPQFWQGLCKAIGRPAWVSQQFADEAHQTVMRDELVAHFGTRTRQEWLTELAGAADLPVAPVHRVEHGATDPQLSHRGTFVPTILPGGSVMSQLSPPMQGSQKFEVWRAMTVTGMDTTEILRELGWSDADIAWMLDDGAAEATVFPVPVGARHEGKQ